MTVHEEDVANLKIGLDLDQGHFLGLGIAVYPGTDLSLDLDPVEKKGGGPDLHLKGIFLIYAL